MAIFKPRLFSSHATRLHTRLTELLLLVVCLVLNFYSPTEKPDECPWSRIFVFYLSRELYCDFIFVYALCTNCCLCTVYTLLFVTFAYLPIPVYSHVWSWFTWTKFYIFVSSTISIFITICTRYVWILLNFNSKNR